MADEKVSQLPNDPSPTLDDLMLTVDLGTGATKKVTLQNLSNLLGKPTLFSNPCKFRVYMASAANSGNNAYAKISFDTKVYDTGSNYNTSTGVFTAPIAGFYQFNWHLHVANSGTGSATLSALHVNGNQAAYGIQQVTTNVSVGTGGSDTIQLSANDTVDVRLFCTQTQPLSGTQSYVNYFSGFLISAT